MDWFPLINSLRIAALATAAVFLLGIWFACAVAKLPRAWKALVDVVLTLPLVLPPTVVGFLLLMVLGPRRPLGAWALEAFGVRLTMVWYAAVFASVVVAFPLRYRTARGAFEGFDEDLADAARTLGKGEVWIFWRVKLPSCRTSIIAGAVLAFARALGEYGATSMVAGYTPGVTATVSTTVYQLWQIGSDALALRWVLVNIAISAVALFVLNWLEGRDREGRRRR